MTLRVCKIHFSTSWCERVDLFILWLGSNARFILALSAHSRFFKFILANNCLSFNNLVPASFIAISCVRSIKIPRYARIVTCVTPSIVLFSRRIVAIPSAYNPHSELTLSTVGVIWKIMRGFTCGLRMLHFRLKSNSGKKEALMHIYIYKYDQFKFSISKDSYAIFPLILSKEFWIYACHKKNSLIYNYYLPLLNNMHYENLEIYI